MLPSGEWYGAIYLAAAGRGSPGLASRLPGGDPRRLIFFLLSVPPRQQVVTLPFLSCSLSQPTRQTRRADHTSFIPISARTDVYKYSFFPRTLLHWNTLVCWSPSQVLIVCKQVSWSGRLSHDTPAVKGDWINWLIDWLTDSYMCGFFQWCSCRGLILYFAAVDIEQQKHGWPVWVYMEPWDGHAAADEPG